TAVLRWEPDLEIVGEAADGREALRLILEHRPDVVLLDLRLPEMSGVEVMQQARVQAPEVRFLVLTTYDTDSYIAPALAAGARGYLLKDASLDELLRGVRAGWKAAPPWSRPWPRGSWTAWPTRRGASCRTASARCCACSSPAQATRASPSSSTSPRTP